jgi:hypothetical protein
MKLFPNWTLYQYIIEFDPPQEYKKLKCGLVHGGLKDLFNGNLAFDGTNAFSLTKLPNEVIKTSLK